MTRLNKRHISTEFAKSESSSTSAPVCRRLLGHDLQKQVFFLLLAFAWLLPASARGQVPQPKEQPAKAQQSQAEGSRDLEILPCSPEPGNAAGESSHGLVMLLPRRPLYIQCEITHAGQSLAQVRQVYLQELVKSLDVNMDGKVGFDETTKHPLFVSGRRFTRNSFLNSLRSKRSYSDEQLRLAVDRAAGQIVAIRENNSLMDRDLGVFTVLDGDGSGTIDRREMRSAPSRIADRDQDFDKIVTLEEFMDAPAVDPMDQVAMPIDTAPPVSVHSSLLRNAIEPILAPRLVRKYDRDLDAHLSCEELQWDEKRFSMLDSNGDQRLTIQELTKFPTTAPDVRLEIELASARSDEASLKLLCADPSLQIEQDIRDVLLVRCGDVTLSIGYRQRDPIDEAERDALFVFNAIDADANGYLDREEIVDHRRFERYLFDAMDANEDDLVFAEELLSFVRAYTEPAATSCQVSLFDLGNGYFQLLDANTDGRISIRELRRTEDSLLQVSQAGVINPSLMPKTYRIEFVRGGGGMFGAFGGNADGNGQPAEALIQAPIGPVWFQRMDRNSDGDLTWEEFLGPREVFHRLDRDHDDLIDYREAEMADK